MAEKAFSLVDGRMAEKFIQLDIRLGKDAIQLWIGSRLLAQRCGIAFFFGGTIVYLLQPGTAGCWLKKRSAWLNGKKPFNCGCWCFLRLS